MLNPNSDTGIDFILNLNTESTSLVDVPVTMNVKIPLSSVTTFPLPPIHLIQPRQQTPVLTPTIIPTISSIPGIVDTYLANKMNEAVKTAVQLQSGRLRDEAQAENEDFINKLDGNIKKIIKEQVKVQVKEQVSNIFPRIEKLVNEQLEAEALTRSSNEAKTSHAVSANLSELELKKILIDKMKSNKSIHRLDQHKTLYKALIDAYETKKSYLIHMEIVSRLKDIEMMRMMTKNPSLDQTEGPREKDLEKNPIHPVHQRKRPPSQLANEPIHTAKDLKEPAPQEFNTGFTEDQPVEEASQLPDWFQKLAKPSTP
nr:hypothetical protein [Tanacetum cinerariifolium]